MATALKESVFRQKRSSLSRFVPFITNGGSNLEKDSNGLIEAFHDIPVEKLLQSPFLDVGLDEISYSSEIYCLLLVPAFMIPVDLVNYVSSSLKDIVALQIYRHQFAPDKYLATIKFVSWISGHAFFKAFHGQVLSSLDPVRCYLFPVKSVSLNGIPSWVHQHANLENDKEEENKKSEPVLGSEAIHTSTSNVASDETCALCLEPMLLPRSITLCCCHSFHLECVARLTTAQCPVCRFQHDEERPSLSVCGVCGWDGLSDDMDTTAVTAEGSNEITGENVLCTISPSSSSLPRRQSLASHSRNDYNSLGAAAYEIGRGREERESSEGRRQSHPFSSSSSSSCGETRYDQNTRRDVWVCLVCGFVGCGLGRRGHIQHHYRTHLHTYAMNTDTRLVWDFAGDGYVHRLALHLHDTDNVGSTESSLTAAATTTIATGGSRYEPRAGVTSLPPSSSKIVEVVDPSLRVPFSSSERAEGTDMMYVGPAASSSSSSSPRMTGVQEQQQLQWGRPGDPRVASPPPASELHDAVNGKLAAAAGQYNQLLVWQLDQQRSTYEARLSAARAAMRAEATHILTLPRYGQKDGENGNDDRWWMQLLMRQIESEKAKLIRQRESLRTREAELRKECGDLEELGKSLRQNAFTWKEKVAEAHASLQEKEKYYRGWKATLEKKVAALMSELDASAAAPSSSSSGVSLKAPPALP